MAITKGRVFDVPEKVSESDRIQNTVIYLLRTKPAEFKKEFLICIENLFMTSEAKGIGNKTLGLLIALRKIPRDHIAIIFFTNTDLWIHAVLYKDTIERVNLEQQLAGVILFHSL